MSSPIPNPACARNSDKLRSLIKQGADEAALRYEERLGVFLDCCESPIEKLLLAALFSDHDTHEFNVVFMGDLGHPSRFLKGETIYVYQQASVGEYRADFLIHDCSVPLEVGEPRWIAVECDGHDFHEKTKEQARRDKRRDRFFQSQGIRVLRFAGSEIWASPEDCAEEVFRNLATNDGFRLSLGELGAVKGPDTKNWGEVK